MKISEIQRDWQVFAKEGAVAVGAVREVGEHAITIYIEGHGDEQLTEQHISSIHDAKVVLNMDALPDEFREAIEAAHDGEDKVLKQHRPVDG